MRREGVERRATREGSALDLPLSVMSVMRERESRSAERRVVALCVLIGWGPRRGLLVGRSRAVMSGAFDADEWLGVEFEVNP